MNDGESLYYIMYRAGNEMATTKSYILYILLDVNFKLLIFSYNYNYI